MKNILIFTLLLFSHFTMGQITVSGTISDENQEPLIGATVSVKSTGEGTTTDVDGRYSVSVPDNNATLVFSYIGYTSQEIALNGRTSLDVVMATGLALDEIVFIVFVFSENIQIILY